MERVNEPDAKKVAVMHDLLEDTSTTKADLQQLGFSSDVVTAVIALTKLKNDNRYTAAQRTVKNAIACQVKLADLADNMDLSRLQRVTAKDIARMKQYEIVRQTIDEAHQFYQLLQSSPTPNSYPAFHYASRQNNYQYWMNLRLDLLYPHGGLAIGSVQEGYILFEDCAAYLSWCKRHTKEIHLSYAMQLVANTDQILFDGYFTDPTSLIIIRQILLEFKEFYA